jgi:AcrR family transcriptional regulator
MAAYDDMATRTLRSSLAERRPKEVSHNLAGQRLGRKGQETRTRILTAMLRLFADPEGPPVTMSSVAREAQVRLTNLYLYFPDFGELLLAALERVMADADAAFVDMLRTRWPDDRLGECCTEFIHAYYRFWKDHARVLHMRNTIADSDVRVAEYRQSATRPLIRLLVRQMDAEDADPSLGGAQMASAVLTGFERVATVLTNPYFHATVGVEGVDAETIIGRMLRAQARLVELAIRDQRAAVRG